MQSLSIRDLSLRYKQSVMKAKVKGEKGEGRQVRFYSNLQIRRFPNGFC